MQRSARSLLQSITRYSIPQSRKPRSPSLPKNPTGSRNRPTSIFCPLRLNFAPNPPTQFTNISSRGFSGLADHGKEVDEINLKFAEAREEIEAAMESKETVYFDEEAECARDAANDVLGLYNGLLAKLSEDDRTALQQSMGLKMEQLKAELQQLED